MDNKNVLYFQTDIIMDEWIRLNFLMDILRLEYDAVIKRIKRGKFTTARQVKGVHTDGRSIGRNGLIWQVHIDDPAIPEPARESFKQAQAKALFSAIRESAAQSGAATPPETSAIIRSFGLPDTEFNQSIIQSALDRQKIGTKTAEERRQKAAMDLAKFNQLPSKKQAAANAKLEVLKALDLWIQVNKETGSGETVKTDYFIREYNTGNIPIPQDTKTKIPTLSSRTLFRWRSLYNDGGILALAENYKSHAGATTLTQAQQKLAIAMQIEFPGCATQKVADALAARNMAADVSVIRRFVKHWLQKNASLHLYMTNPDAWKNKHMLAYGDASEAVIRLNQIWEMDSTPGDVLLVDGRHTIIGCIDVYSRRLRLLVSPTSKAVAVAALIRRCIIEWGVAEGIKTDNGQDYVSAHIEWVLGGLEIRHILCPPFSPEKKPHIERALGTFSHGIVELLPGYCGHSVADRKTIEARKSFASRLMDKDAEPISISLTSLEFQRICDRWVDAMYMQASHGGLNGKTPIEIVREWQHPVEKVADVRALDALLAPAAGGSGYRTITKKGIKVDSRTYMSPTLAHSKYHGQRVAVREDETDLGHIYVYADTGEFICMAEDPKWKGISPSELANHAKNRQKAIMQEQSKELKRLVKEAKANTVPEDILVWKEEKIEKVVEFPKPSSAYITPSLEEAAKAAVDRDYITRDKAAPKYKELPEEVIAFEKRRAENAAKKAEATKGLRFVESPLDVYYELEAKEKAGTITAYELSWKAAFEAWEKNPRFKPSLLKDDKWCVKDPEKQKKQEAAG